MTTTSTTWQGLDPPTLENDLNSILQCRGLGSLTGFLALVEQLHAECHSCPQSSLLLSCFGFNCKEMFLVIDVNLITVPFSQTSLKQGNDSCHEFWNYDCLNDFGIIYTSFFLINCHMCVCHQPLDKPVFTYFKAQEPEILNSNSKLTFNLPGAFAELTQCLLFCVCGFFFF